MKILNIQHHHFYPFEMDTSLCSVIRERKSSPKKMHHITIVSKYVDKYLSRVPWHCKLESGPNLLVRTLLSASWIYLYSAYTVSIWRPCLWVVALSALDLQYPVKNHVIYCFGTVSKFLNFLTSNLVVSALENACLAVYVSINVYLLSLSNKCP